MKNQRFFNRNFKNYSVKFRPMRKMMILDIYKNCRNTFPLSKIWEYLRVLKTKQQKVVKAFT